MLSLAPVKSLRCINVFLHWPGGRLTMKQVTVILLVFTIPVAFTSECISLLPCFILRVWSVLCYLGVGSRRELSALLIRTGVRQYKYHTAQLGLPWNLAMRLWDFEAVNDKACYQLANIYRWDDWRAAKLCVKNVFLFILKAFLKKRSN